MPILKGEDDSRIVVLGSGDLRIAVANDIQTNMRLICVAQADKPVPLDADLSKEDPFQYSYQVLLTSFTKEGLGNFISILQNAYTDWPDAKEVLLRLKELRIVEGESNELDEKGGHG